MSVTSRQSRNGDGNATATATRGRDGRLVRTLAAALRGLRDFADASADAATTYATCVVRTLRERAVDADAFRDQLIGILANVKSLDGELTAQSITAEQLATMDVADMVSAAQRRARRAHARKRMREQLSIDRTRMLCDKCGLVRRDRLNVNEVGLDSEENGTQFDYNFDNTCDCSHSSTEREDDDSDDDDDEGEQQQRQQQQEQDKRPAQRSDDKTPTSSATAGDASEKQSSHDDGNDAAATTTTTRSGT